jgi:hypothetical protein
VENKEKYILNIVGFDFRAMREKQLKCIKKIEVHLFKDGGSTYIT